MKKIVLATTNQHKLKEVRSILYNYEILSLKDIAFNQEIDETGETTEEIQSLLDSFNDWSK